MARKKKAAPAPKTETQAQSQDEGREPKPIAKAEVVTEEVKETVEAPRDPSVCDCKSGVKPRPFVHKDTVQFWYCDNCGRAKKAEWEAVH